MVDHSKIDNDTLRDYFRNLTWKVPVAEWGEDRSLVALETAFPLPEPELPIHHFDRTDWHRCRGLLSKTFEIVAHQIHMVVGEKGEHAMRIVGEKNIAQLLGQNSHSAKLSSSRSPHEIAMLNAGGCC